MKENYKITVFTPTFNRAYIIDRLYTSLIHQTFCDFEWLVVDDGSTDETEELFSRWIADEKITIRYYKQENGGKCRAINKGVDLAKGELFFTVDSDDYLSCDALEKIAKWESELPKNMKYCGVAGNLGVSETETPNTLFDTDYYDGSLLDRYSKVDGERAIVIYTDVHKLYKYPVFQDEKFMTEAVVWNRMAHDGYKMRFFNDIIWIYEYQSDGLTLAGNRIFLDNPRGYCLWLYEKMNFENKDSFVSYFRYVYGMNSELRNCYNKRKIAECLNTNVWAIRLCDFIFCLKNRRKA